MSWWLLVAALVFPWLSWLPVGRWDRMRMHTACRSTALLWGSRCPPCSRSSCSRCSCRSPSPGSCSPRKSPHSCGNQLLCSSHTPGREELCICEKNCCSSNPMLIKPAIKLESPIRAVPRVGVASGALHQTRTLGTANPVEAAICGKVKHQGPQSHRIRARGRRRWC